MHDTEQIHSFVLFPFYDISDGHVTYIICEDWFLEHSRNQEKVRLY